jgi:hypothetical protein
MYVSTLHLLMDCTYRQDRSSSREIHQACCQQFCKLLAETKDFAYIQVRSKLTDPETGRIAFSSELIAGGSAGGAQVLSQSLASSR